MIELNVLDALMAAGQALAFASLIYFFYLIVMHGDLLRHAEGDPGTLREAHPAVYRGEPEHGIAVSLIDEIAASAVRTARAR